jgi:ADP-ribosylglycohydrolase
LLKDRLNLRFSNGLTYELMQVKDEGKDVGLLEEKVKKILGMDDCDPGKQLSAAALYDEIQTMPIVEGYQYVEPSGLEEIKAARPQSGAMSAKTVLSEDILFDKVYGAWLGRCAGCLLGKPVEGWYRERIYGLLNDTDNYPFKYYMSSDIDDKLIKKYNMYEYEWNKWINDVSCMPEDDDTNYTLMGLEILEQYGVDFTPDNVAEYWLNNLPILHTHFSERVAYRNFVNSIFPPESGNCKNPYREWIGAQIRADFYGYVTPGKPELGAEFAWRDACISHVKNGIYGEMFIAAMLSAAAVSSSMEEIIQTGLGQIPEKSRLAEKVYEVLGWKKKGLTWEQALDRLHEAYDEKCDYDSTHTIPNAMIVCIALLYGEYDFEKYIGIAVLGGLDTDCNGATVGSIAGMVLGAGALPEKWIAPLNDQLISGVNGLGSVRISDMAKRTVNLIRTINNTHKK